MIAYLSRFKYWQIAAAGILGAFGGIWAVAGAALWARVAWPQAADAIHAAYFIAAAITAWAIVGIASEAVLRKHRTAQVNEAMDRIMDVVAGFDKAAKAADHG